jgi:ubiquinone/menaquinone biosynthesis C-methylase UbiE
MTSARPAPAAPNHHRDARAFSGIAGLLAGLTMILGRGAVAHLAADQAGVTDEDRVVDVGCGPGTAARYAARRGARVVGVDPAPMMLRLARWLTVGDQSITWTEGAAEAVSLPDRSATVLWSISTVHHWSDLDAGLAEARRVLVPQGRLLAIERRTRPRAKGLASHGWTDAQAAVFAELASAVGFTDAHVEVCTAGRRRMLVVGATRA